MEFISKSGNKFEALVKNVQKEIKGQTNIDINISSFKTFDNQGKLTNAIPPKNMKNIIQTDDIIDYLILIDFYNDIIDYYKDSNEQIKETKERIYLTASVLARTIKENTEPYCRMISDYTGDTDKLNEATEQKQYCLTEKSSKISFKEIHDFVTPESNKITGGKPKSNKKRKTNKRKKTNKRRKTNKRKRTKSKTNKRKKRTRRRR